MKNVGLQHSRRPLLHLPPHSPNLRVPQLLGRSVAHLLLHTQEVRLTGLRILHEHKRHPSLVPPVRKISEGERVTTSLTTVMPFLTNCPCRHEG